MQLTDPARIKLDKCEPACPCTKQLLYYYPQKQTLLLTTPYLAAQTFADSLVHITPSTFETSQMIFWPSAHMP